jgi:hypothetical protein
MAEDPAPLNWTGLAAKELTPANIIATNAMMVAVLVVRFIISVVLMAQICAAGGEPPSCELQQCEVLIPPRKPGFFLEAAQQTTQRRTAERESPCRKTETALRVGGTIAEFCCGKTTAKLKLR